MSEQGPGDGVDSELKHTRAFMDTEQAGEAAATTRVLYLLVEKGI